MWIIGALVAAVAACYRWARRRRNPPTRGVALTALAMAQERKVETARDDGLVDDPWAGAFLEAARVDPQAPLPWIGEGRTLSDVCPAMGDYVALRTRLFDSWALHAVPDIRQVVLPAAGLDTRAYRLAWPAGVRLFEIDFPELIGFKQRTLSGAHPACHRTAIPADLAGDWETPLLDNGFHPERPALWLIEGLLMYLGDHDRLLRRITALSAPGSHLIADHAYPEALRSDAFADGSRILASNGSAIHGTVADPVAWLAGHGWDAAVAKPTEVLADSGRALPAVLRPESPVFWLATAQRR